MADYVFNVAPLVFASSGESREFAVEAPAAVLDVPELAGPVTGMLRAVRLVDSIHVSGTFAADVSQPCARCLELTATRITFDADDEFVPHVDPQTGAPLPEDDRWRLDAHHQLNLAPMLAEGVVAALPLMPLCRPECQGLGAAAAIPEPVIDPRLAPLQRLRATMFSPDSESEG